MAAPSRYAEALWQFSLKLSSKMRGAVACSVFPSEEALFAAEANQSDTAPSMFWLPSELVSTQRSSSAPWTRERPSTADALHLGQQLWNAIPDAAKQTLVDAGAQPHRPRRIKIITNTPALDDLPWEWLTDGAGPPFALRPRIQLVRSLPQLFPIPALTVEKPIRVMLVITNPKDERLLRADEEIRAVQGRLHAPDYSLDVLTTATLNALIERVHQSAPHVLHYIGHAGIAGGAEGNLILQDQENVSHWITPTTVAPRLPASVRLLCLSTCVTVRNYQILGLPHFAHAPRELPLPTMVVNQYPLGAESVPPFWDTFYDTLLSSDGDVTEAVHRARQAVVARSPQSADWASFRVVLRDREGVAFRLGVPRTASTFAAQVQAQFASRLANDLADEVRTKGAHASDDMREHLNRASRSFTDLNRDLA
jgi:hypothetical protein